MPYYRVRQVGLPDWSRDFQADSDEAAIAYVKDDALDLWYRYGGPTDGPVWVDLVVDRYATAAEIVRMNDIPPLLADEARYWIEQGESDMLLPVTIAEVHIDLPQLEAKQ